MVKIIDQNLFTPKAGILTHQVNLMGHMGGYLGTQMKQRWDGMVWQRYRIYIDPVIPEHKWAIGKIQLIQVEPGLWVCNLAGQINYGRKGSGCYTDYDAVKKGLAKLQQFAEARKLQIYLPFGMGCHAAGGKWERILSLIEAECPNAIICHHHSFKKQNV